MTDVRLSGGDALLIQVEAHLLTTFGADSGRASISFLGAERIDILRFGADGAGLLRYVTLGMSREPMTNPAEYDANAGGPRAELVLTMRGLIDEVFRPLAVLAATPAAEGIVVVPGAGLDVGEPLWPGGQCTAVLVGEPGGLVTDLEVDGESVQFLPVLPMTANESAWKRVHGPQALEERWLKAGTDLRDPHRAGVRLG